MRLCSPEQPYPGLRPFEPEEAAYFCGRRREIERLEAMIRKQRLVAVLGSSGAGKSSLVLAGALPRVTKDRQPEGGPVWQVVRIRPGRTPFHALAQAAAELGRKLQDAPEMVIPVLRDRALGLLRRSSQGLQQVARELGLPAGTHLLLIIDQFEELFRYVGFDRGAAQRADQEARDRDDEAAAFAAALLAVGECQVPQVHVVITMRSDFVGDCARFLGLPEAVDAGQFLVPRMSRSQLDAAVREPLRLSGASISPALVQRVLNDAGTQPDALPVLQHALLRTWERAGQGSDAEDQQGVPKRYSLPPISPEAGPPAGEAAAILAAAASDNSSGRLLLPRHYEAAGTMAGALSHHADAILDELGARDPELPELARWLFRALSDVDKEGSAVRRPQRFVELVALVGLKRHAKMRIVVDRFREDDCNFLTPAKSSLAKLEASTVLDLAHEALARNWDKLKGQPDQPGWLAEEFKDGLIWRSLLVEAEAFAHDRRRTLSPAATNERAPWLRGLPSPFWARRHGGGWLGVSALVAGSVCAAKQARTRHRIRTGAYIASALALFLLLGVLATKEIALVQRNELWFVLEARSQLRDGDPATAMRTALTALTDDYHDHMSLSRAFLRYLPAVWEVDPLPRAELLGILAEGLHEPRERLEIQGPPKSLAAVALSPDGNMLATAGRDGTVRLWDSATGEAQGSPIGHKGAVTFAAFSPTGTLVTAGEDGTVRLWDRARGKQRILREKGGAVWAVAFSADLGTLATADVDGLTVYKLDGATGDWHAGLTDHSGLYLTVASTDDGATLATADGDGTVRLWDAVSGEKRLELEGHSGLTWTMAFSDDGSMLATAGEDGAVRLWDTRTGKLGKLFRHKGGVVYGLAFHGRMLATVGEDRTARLWDVEAGEPKFVMRVHSGSVLAVAFSSDGRMLASAGEDGTARLWDISAERAYSLRDSSGSAVLAVAYSPNGDKFATGSQDGTVRLVDARSGKQAKELRKHERAVFTVAFSPRGSILATAGWDGKVHLWDAVTGDWRNVLKPSAGAATLAFNFDGTILATGGWDGTVELWDVATRGKANAWQAHHEMIRAIAFSRDDALLATAGADGIVQLWDPRSGKNRGVFRRNGEADRAAPVRSDRTAPNLTYEDIAISDLRFVQDDTMLVASGEDGTVRLWSVVKLEQRRTLTGHIGGISHLAVAANDHRLATAGRDGTVRLWDLNTGEPRVVWRAHDGEVNSVAFAPDGRSIITAGDDSTAHRYWIGDSPEDLINAARRQLPREISMTN